MAPVISRNRRVTHQSTYRDETDTACIANAVSSTTGGVSTLTLDDILIVSDKYNAYGGSEWPLMRRSVAVVRSEWPSGFAH